MSRSRLHTTERPCVRGTLNILLTSLLVVLAMGQLQPAPLSTCAFEGLNAEINAHVVLMSSLGDLSHSQPLLIECLTALDKAFSSRK